MTTESKQLCGLITVVNYDPSFYRESHLQLLTTSKTELIPQTQEWYNRH